jgi:circadian clock protein KaiB
MKRLPHFKFRLYIAGAGPHSSLAIVNLKAICAEHLPDRHDIEVVDVLLEKRRALADGVMLTPLLVKVSPAPTVKILGTMSFADPLLEALGLLNSSR